MTGRSRLEIGTYGDISTRRTAVGTVVAEARHRDGDGQVRKVTATASSANAAKHALRTKLQRRITATGFGNALSSESTVAQLAEAWLGDLLVRTDLADGSKDTYRRELQSLVLPHFKSLLLREVTTGRVDEFLKRQALISYARAKHSRVVLSLMFAYALRHDFVQVNPVSGVSQLRAPKRKPKALNPEQVHLVRRAASNWRTQQDELGRHPDGQVCDVIEVLLGATCRIGEALALRKCDINDTGSPMKVTVSGTLVVVKGKPVYRQDHPKTGSSRRVLEVPEFTAEVLRRRLTLIEDRADEHLIFYTRNDTPLAPYNVRRTLRQMLRDAGLHDLKVTPHTFRRTAGTLIARATDAETAAAALGNSPEIAKKHYIEPEEPTSNPAPARYLQSLAPRTAARHPDTEVATAHAVSAAQSSPNPEEHADDLVRNLTSDGVRAGQRSHKGQA